jgi:hypothetical protein
MMRSGEEYVAFAGRRIALGPSTKSLDYQLAVSERYRVKGGGGSAALKCSHPSETIRVGKSRKQKSTLLGGPRCSI